MAIALAKLARGKPRRVLLLAALAAAPMAAAEPAFPLPIASEADDSETLVDIPDAALRKAVEEALDKAAGDPITRGEMADLRALHSSEGVRQLTGIEYATNLRNLGLGNGAITDMSHLAGLTALTTLYLHNNEISDVSPLAGLTALTHLHLGQNGISDVSPLADLTALTTLWLHDNEISDVSPLAGMTALTYLHLFRNEIREPGPLADLTALTRLYLGQNGISDVSPLADLTALTTLWLYDNEISDVSPLAGMTALTSLALSENEISDLSPLADLAALTHLYLGDNEISDLSPLADLTALTSLALGNSEISDLSPLADLTALTHLYLGDNEISDLSPLADLTALTHLYLGDNEISDLSPLADLTALTSLALGNSEISDVSPLAGLTALTHLHLSVNAVADITPPAAMTSLTELDLSHNGISDASPLSGLTSLTTLKLYGNPIIELGPLSDLTSLTTLELNGNRIIELGPLSDLTSLTTLNLIANEISDVSPLVANGGLGDGDVVDLRWNPLGETAREEHIPALLQRGVEVRFDANALPDLTEMRDGRLRQAVELALSHLVPRWRLQRDGKDWFFQEREDLATLASLDASNLGIEDLAGLEAAAGLRGLFLDGNRITDIAALSGLGSLRVLTLAHNMVEDLAPLAAMESLGILALDGNSLRDLRPLPASLRRLYLSDNSISDIASLADLYLFELDVSGNAITSLAPLAGHGNLWYLHVSDNQVADISPLNFEPLRELHLRNNAVRDLSPLLNAEELLMVDARRNPLADDALAVLDTLRERRVTVLAGETVPYFPAAGGRRQGFARIVNRSDEDGHVFIDAVDDAGVRARRVRLDVGARRAVHFNSEDLERGNAAKGLSGGVGAPTAGDWRLSVVSALDVEVLSYIRTEDGFVTAMHDVAADAMVPFFNPGSNENQRSILRVVNTEAEPAKWTTGGYDDRGYWRPMAGALLVRPQHALTLTAQALENTHGLGDGQGKWRLRARGFPWFAMSLLESPTGHLVNLSTAPDNATPLADGGAMHRLPLFPAAGGARQGFARVINRSYSSGGEVAIVAVDDEGVRSGPVRLTMRPRRAAHFNSADLETGNAAKGLDGGVGVGAGDWRLEVASELDLMVLSYARTADGFLTSLHDLAPVAEDGGHRVVFFNPGSNTGQVSKLRLINDGGEAASVTVTGIDDHGNGSGTVTLTVPAGSARTFTSAELEAGGDGLAGRLGDGSGKWRLRVRSDAPIAVMSLLETPSGHLTNVSTGTAD